MQPNAFKRSDPRLNIVSVVVMLLQMGFRRDLLLSIPVILMALVFTFMTKPARFGKIKMTG